MTCLLYILNIDRGVRYVEVLGAAVARGGHLVVAAFGPAGPRRSGRPHLLWYAADEVGAILGPSFHLVRSHFEAHLAPGRRAQQVLYGWWKVLRHRLRGAKALSVAAPAAAAGYAQRSRAGRAGGHAKCNCGALSGPHHGSAEQNEYNEPRSS